MPIEPVTQEDRLGECEDLLCKKFTFLKYTHCEEIYLCKECHEITTELETMGDSRNKRGRG